MRVSSVGQVLVAKYLASWEVTGSNILDVLGVRPCLFGRWVDPFRLSYLDFFRGCSSHPMSMNHLKKTYPKEDNFEDVALLLEQLENAIFDDDDYGEMLLPSMSMVTLTKAPVVGPSFLDLLSCTFT